MALSPEGAEHMLSLVAPQIRHNRCSHKDERGRWNYWEAGSGLCWCNKCGMCLNRRLRVRSRLLQEPVAMSEESKIHGVLHLDMEEIRAMWSSAFASAVVSLHEWVPDNLAVGEDIRLRRRRQCVVLANFAVQEYRAARDEAPEPAKYNYQVEVQNAIHNGAVTIHIADGATTSFMMSRQCLLADQRLRHHAHRASRRHAVRLHLRVSQDNVGGHKITWQTHVIRSPLHAGEFNPDRTIKRAPPRLTLTPSATDIVVIARNGLGEYVSRCSYNYT